MIVNIVVRKNIEPTTDKNQLAEHRAEAVLEVEQATNILIANGYKAAKEPQITIWDEQWHLAGSAIRIVQELEKL